MIVALDAQWSAVARGYRHALIVAGVLGLAAVGASVAAGQPIAGLFVCVGLGLGCYNSRRLWSETTKLKGDEENPRQFMVWTSAKRLGLVTLLGFLIALAYRSVGWTVFVGLVVFQLVLMAMLLRPLRQVITPTRAVAR
jgi:predicted lysophospholipase L1 biosynthesis ABC-type transport system permease subunit